MSKTIKVKLLSSNNIVDIIIDDALTTLSDCDKVVVECDGDKFLASVLDQNALKKDCDNNENESQNKQQCCSSNNSNSLASNDATNKTFTFVKMANNFEINKFEELQSKAQKALEKTRQIVEKQKLDMRLVSAEYTIDEKKLIITYVSDERVDFRNLVKELVSLYKTKIELKQIGIRDQAKLVGGIGQCGQECCCIRYLNDFEKVSIKMAKTQSLSLNPANISGICGRLMCCLSFENSHYEETGNRMPKLHSKVKTPQGEGIVIYNNILKEKCSVKIGIDDYKIIEFDLHEIQFKDFMKKNCPMKNQNSASN